MVAEDEFSVWCVYSVRGAARLKLDENQMITQSQVMPLLLDACPGFQPVWQEHLAWWKGEEPGAFNDAAEFARYLVESYERGETHEFTAAFAAVEMTLIEGDEEARGLATIGVIEALQTVASHSCGAHVFVQWLGPTSRVAWAQIEKLWQGKRSLMDVIRSERHHLERKIP